jgi:hypothetical protein
MHPLDKQLAKTIHIFNLYSQKTYIHLFHIPATIFGFKNTTI